MHKLSTQLHHITPQNLPRPKDYQIISIPLKTQKSLSKLQILFQIMPIEIHEKRVMLLRRIVRLKILAHQKLTLHLG